MDYPSIRIPVGAFRLGVLIHNDIKIDSFLDGIKLFKSIYHCEIDELYTSLTFTSGINIVNFAKANQHKVRAIRTDDANGPYKYLQMVDELMRESHGFLGIFKQSNKSPLIDYASKLAYQSGKPLLTVILNDEANFNKAVQITNQSYFDYTQNPQSASTN